MLSLLLALPLLGVTSQEPGGAEFVFLDSQRKPFEAPAEVLAAFEQAAHVWEEVLLDDVTIYVRTSYEELDSEAELGGWVPEFLEFPAETVFEAMREDSSSPHDRRSLRAMPMPTGVTVVPGPTGRGRKVFTLNAWLTNRNGEYFQQSIAQLSVTGAQAKALVLIPTDEEGWDMTLKINSDVRWDLNPNDGIKSGYFDLVGTLTREIGHGLGFFSGLDSETYLTRPGSVFGVLDMFRFNDASGTMRWDLGRGGNPVFSNLDGRQPLAPFAADVTRGAARWRGGADSGSYLGIMIEGQMRSLAGSVLELDLIAFDVLGWEIKGFMDRAPKREMSKDGQLLRSPKMELRRAESLNQWYQDAPDWALAGIVLTAYGKRWHPLGVTSFIDALGSKDIYRKAYAIEALLNTDEAMLPSVVSAKLVDVLINKSLRVKDDYFANRVLLLLKRSLPGVEASKASQWKRWWKNNRESYVPSDWTVPALPFGAESSDESVAQGFVERAFDLYSAGVELVIVMDATGSMQGVIDASVEALQDFAGLMQGISPKFRMGLVEYRDHGDMKNGAKISEPLSKNIKKVQKELSKVRAGGGGDFPEAVLAGLQAAFSKKMGWQEPANKLLVVVGDAPPHDNNMEEILTLVQEAHDSPFGKKASSVLEHRRDGKSRGKSGSKRGVRPFVTSAIGAGALQVHGLTRNAFAKIAEAGGGAYSEVLTAGEDGRAASVEIAEHILTLSFGARWRNQMHDFVRIYMQYRSAGTFK
jgi:hypothetical protein